MKQTNLQIKKLLTKLATGFEYNETVEEFVPDKESGDFVLAKRKISSHYVAPDIAAIKMLIGLEDVVDDFQNMTDAELIALKNQLIRELAEGGKK